MLKTVWAWMPIQSISRIFLQNIRTVSNVNQTRLNVSTFVAFFFYFEISTCPFIDFLIYLLCCGSQISAPFNNIYISSDFTISREYQCSLINAFFRRLTFAFNYTFLFNLIPG